MGRGRGHQRGLQVIVRQTVKAVHVIVLVLLFPHKFGQAGLEQSITGARLALQLSLCPHPHVVSVLSVDFRVVWVHKVLLMKNHLTSVRPAP